MGSGGEWDNWDQVMVYKAIVYWFRDIIRAWLVCHHWYAKGKLLLEIVGVDECAKGKLLLETVGVDECENVFLIVYINS